MILAHQIHGVAALELTQFTNALNNNEESSEEQECVPLHPVQRLVAMVHVERDEQPA